MMVRIHSDGSSVYTPTVVPHTWYRHKNICRETSPPYGVRHLPVEISWRVIDLKRDGRYMEATLVPYDRHVLETWGSYKAQMMMGVWWEEWNVCELGMRVAVEMADRNPDQTWRAISSRDNRLHTEKWFGD